MAHREAPPAVGGFLYGHPLAYLLAAAGCTVLESIPAFDQLAQAPFFPHGEWLVSKAFHLRYRWLLYTGPKVCIYILAVAVLLVLLASFSPRFRVRLRAWRNPSLCILASVILVPLTVAGLKAVSGIHGPMDTIPYGGSAPHIGLLGQLWMDGTLANGRSFPAGHASGGFALMALYCLPVARNGKRALFCFGLCAGWGMGLYQMARGEHFLSHTMTTMFLALAIIAAIGERLDAVTRLRAGAAAASR